MLQSIIARLSSPKGRLSTSIPKSGALPIMYSLTITLLLSAFDALTYGQVQQSLIDRAIPATYKVKPSEWAALNASIGGRLYATGRPIGFPCFTSYNGTGKTPDIAACTDVMNKQNNGTFVATNYGGYFQVSRTPFPMNRP